MKVLFFTIILTFLVAASAHADIAVPQVFSDHMILQGEMAAPIFGTAAPGEKVTVQIKGQTKRTVAGKDGKWMIKLTPLKPGGPYELKIAGKNTIIIKDVLVGEVWLASGQSNMRYPLVRAKNGKTEMSKANFPKIRYYKGKGPWIICSPRSCRNFSAVAYFFAVDLHSSRKVPVGIIENAVNGAVAQVFVSKEAFDADPELTAMVSKHKHNTGANGSVWNKSIAPVVPYGIKGALWFQGEGNRDFPVTYRKLLTTLIYDWRKQWGQGDFPFLVCQLTNFRKRSEKPREGKDCSLRDAQLKVVQAVPNTALVVTIDLNEIEDVHFPNKKPCGQRLAIAARAIAYKEKIEYSGPIFKKVKFKQGKAIISFDHIGSGLMLKGNKLKSFLLCGPDKKWQRSDAVIQGDQVVVSTPGITKATGVRYGWELNPECNLYNKEGLPASPFRSDNYQNYWTRDGD